MPRKTDKSLEAQRNRIKRSYKRGKKTEKVIRGESALNEVELACAKLSACYLKAADFSYTYIGEALGVSKDTVRRWFADPEMHKIVEGIHADYVQGAVRLLKTYAIEAIEIVMEIARATDDDGVALKAALEVLDRLGISKVNKSESVVASTMRDEVAITDPDGFLEKMRDMAPEKQAEIAAKLEEAFQLADAEEPSV